MKRLILAFSALALYISGLAQTPKKKAPTKITLPAIAAIRPSEIEEDLAGLTDDRFRGREAGTPDELKASVWLAEKARKAGLVPAGEDGTFFQFFSQIVIANSEENNTTEAVRKNKKGLKENLKQLNAPQMQLSIFDAHSQAFEDIRKILEEVDINRLTPVEALLKLQEIKAMVNESIDVNIQQCSTQSKRPAVRIPV